MDYLEMKLEAVSFPNLARLTNLPKFAKAEFKNDDVKFDVKFWKVTPKNKSNLTRKLKCLKRFFIASIHFYFYGIAVSIRKSRHTLDK